MVTAGRKLTITDANGALKQAGVAVEPALYGSIVYSYIWGADWFDPEAYRTGTPKKSTLASTANVNAYQPEGAWKFVKWLTSAPALESYTAYAGFAPARGKVIGQYLTHWPGSPGTRLLGSSWRP